MTVSSASNTSITELLNKSTSEQSCSLPTSLDAVQNALASLDLSFEFDLSQAFVGPYLDGGKYEVVLPEIQTVCDLTVGITISMAFGLLFSIILYNLVLPEQKLSLRKLSVGTLLLASSCLIPYMLFDVLSVNNTAVRFTICTPLVLYMFKTLEAVFGFVPVGAKSSLKMYCQYFTVPSELVFNWESGEPELASMADYIDSAKNVLLSVLRMCALVSFLSHYNYIPFGGTDAGEFFEGVHLKHLQPRHLANCFFIAVFFQQALALGDACMGKNAVQIITGYKVLRSMRNPMLEALSPSDFWGRRWNLIVHSVMKRGVYKPVRKYLNSATLASLMVFVASGLFHEWLVHAVVIYGRTLSGNVHIGSNSAFFLWNFKVIMFERLIVGSNIVQSLRRITPRPIITLAIIMSSLPVAHWFGNPYLNGGFFSDYEKCIILLRQV